jgi:hypothetical protein
MMERRLSNSRRRSFCDEKKLLGMININNEGFAKFREVNLLKQNNQISKPVIPGLND